MYILPLKKNNKIKKERKARYILRQRERKYENSRETDRRFLLQSSGGLVAVEMQRIWGSETYIKRKNATGLTEG